MKDAKNTVTNKQLILHFDVDVLRLRKTNSKDLLVNLFLVRSTNYVLIGHGANWKRIIKITQIKSLAGK